MSPPLSLPSAGGLPSTPAGATRVQRGRGLLIRLFSDGQRVSEFGNDRLPPELVVQTFGESLLGRRLAVDQYDLFGVSFSAPQPHQQFGRVGMSGKPRHPCDVSPHRYPLTVDLDLFIAVDQPPALGALGLIADKQNGVLGIRQAELEVVENAPTGRHAGG